MAILELATITFTPKADTVNGLPQSSRLFVPSGQKVDSLTGSDTLKGRADSPEDDYALNFRFGVYLQDDLRLGPDTSQSRLAWLPGYDDDSMIGEAISATEKTSPIALYGITIGFDSFSNTKLSTGLGKDNIRGTAIYRDVGQSSPNSMVGITVFFGGTIDTAAGHDTITGEACGSAFGVMAGIAATIGNNLISTGEGSDCVTGIAENNGTAAFLTAGIYAGSGIFTIDTGNGADKVSARATSNGERRNGFFAPTPSQLLINLGSGIDKLEGFGTMTADGGSGIDTWDLRGYNRSEFTITKTGPMAATFAGPQGATALISNFELFLFDDGIFSYTSLPQTV